MSETLETLEPVTRLEHYLAKIVGEDVSAPDPFSRKEYFLAKLAEMEVTPPDPVTREEKFLSDLIGEGEAYNLDPVTRLEHFMAKAVNQTEEELEPVTREEIFWQGIAEAYAKVEKTVSGAIVHIKDALAGPAQNVTIAIEPVQDLNGYDHPWPAGGGKNLFPDVLPSSAVAGRIETSGVIGTATNARVFGIPCKSNTDYCFSQATTGVAATVGFGTKLPEVGDSGVYSGNMTNRTSWILNSGENTFIWFTISNSADYSTLVGNQMQIEEGSAATTYSPYSNICPITGWTGANVLKFKNNLLNALEEGDYYNGAKRAFASRWRSADKIPVKQGSKIKFQSDVYRTWFTLCQYDNTGAYLRGSALTIYAVGYVEFEVPSDCYYIAFSTASTTEEAAKSIQILYPDSASADSSYSTLIPISFGSAGTVYGGTLDVINGVLTVTHASVDMGTLTRWGVDERFAHRLFTLPYLGNTRDRKNSTPIICSMYPVAPGAWGITSFGNNGPDNSIAYHATDTGVWVRDDSFATLEEFLAAVTGQTIVYELATPVTHQLTAQQIDLLLGENNLWADTGNTTLTYLADGRASDTEALGILLAGRYHNSGAADEATDAEALNILLGR